MKTVSRALSAAVLVVLSTASAQAASSFWWPPVESTVTIVIRANVPARFDYKLTHLGSVLAQNNIPLTPSHHSLIAAGNQYQADETAACNTANLILPHPLGKPIQLARANYYLLTPSNQRILINRTQTDCP